MLTKENVDSWNELFPDCQINKTNLSNPTEQFLTHALVVYLRRFGYHVEPPFNLNAETKENNRETRLFLIKLARQIDHFLKITDKSYTFTYYDLIRPTPKKTGHTLYILLNYYYYYNLYKENVFKMAGDRIRKLDELMTLINDERLDNEQRKIENENMKSTIDNLSEKELPMARIKFKELEKQRNQQEEELKKLRHSCQELEEKLKHLEEQKKHLRKRLVPEEESQELLKQLQQLKLELAESKELEKTNANHLNECKENDAKLQKMSKEIEKAYEIIPVQVIQQLQELNKQLAKAQKEEHELQLKHKGILQQIEEELQTQKSLEQEKQNKKQEYDTKQNEHMKVLTNKQNILKQKNTEILQLEEEDHVSECQLEEQKDIAQYLVENLSEVLSAYED